MITARAKLDLSGMNRIDGKLGANAQAAVNAAAEYLIADINSHWSPEIPSIRGEAPAVRTGRLKRSVRTKEGTPRISFRSGSGRFSSLADAYTAEVVYAAPYAGTLETGRLERPFVAPAVERVKNTMSPLFGGLFR